MALAADSRPHFKTIADFISSMDKECVVLGLIFRKYISDAFEELHSKEK